MNEKQEMIAKLKDEYNSWRDLLGSMSEAQITAQNLPDNWSIKDVMAHLMEWQQLSIARVQASLSGTEPTLPRWLDGLDPESEEDTDKFNARIYESHSGEPWSSVSRSWENGFLRFVELSAAVPESDLMQEGKYPWLNGYALIEVLEGALEHHAEHREELLAWLAKSS